VSGAVAGPDGRLRCPWGLSAPEYIAYHDEEWGRAIHTDVGLYERMTLEAFQSGLSWLTILRKREGFRKAFGGFDPKTVAAYGPDDVERLLADASIVRNRAKIDATIRNANAALEVEGGLAELLWSFAPDPKARPAPKTLADVPAQTPESKAMAKELKRRGFAFVGPTTAYALMQAAGLVDDHLVDCHARRKETR
jgi:DNA-3-methyladenine glycosylase I